MGRAPSTYSAANEPLPLLASDLSRIHKQPLYEAAVFIVARGSDGSGNEERDPNHTHIWTGQLPAKRKHRIPNPDQIRSDPGHYNR